MNKMNIFQKFSVSFALALTLHITILALFGISFVSDSDNETVKQKLLPEIIQASMLDDEKIQQEAERLKFNENNKRLKDHKKQKALENKLQKEQKRLELAKNKRLQEEKKTKVLEKKRKDLALKEKQKRLQLERLQVEEAAQRANIKKQHAAEKQRTEKLRKKKQEKLKQDRLAEEKQQQAILAKQEALAEKQKAQAAEKAAQVKQQAANAKARSAKNKKAIISSTLAIQRKVNQRWIKPISSAKGLRCTIRVKLLPSGDVMDATIIKGSGNSVFDRSAENAVLKASPLPVPKDRTLFAQKFRTFTFVFKPE